MTPPLCLPARINGEEAARRFTRPRLANLYGLTVRPVRVASAGDASTRVPPFIERLWMPAYAVRLHTSTRGKPGGVWAAVDAWSGQFSLLEREGEIAPREPEEERFPPRLDEREAETLARAGLLQYILRRRGQSKPVIEGVEKVELYYYPLWVLYYRRRRKFLDIKVLDGYTGDTTGAKMRAAIIDALVAARQERLADRRG